MMLKGMTVHYLIHSTYKVKGETVPGTPPRAGRPDRRPVAEETRRDRDRHRSARGSAPLAAHGYKHVINYSTENFVEKVKEITKGKKLPVVYDAVGKTTWDGSLDCLQPRGLMASFGNASGPVPPQNLGILASKGSLYVTRPTLATYIASRADLVKRSTDLFNVVKSGKVKIETTKKYKLADAAQAHRDLEGRQTTGSVVLIP